MQIKQHLIYIISLLVLLVSFFFYLSYREINRSIIHESGEIFSDNVSDSIFIIRDNFSIPTIYTKNLSDLYFSLGKVTSTDRLFQLQVIKLFVNGELSAYFGKDKVVVNPNRGIDKSGIVSDSLVLENVHFYSDKFVKNLFLNDLSDSLLSYLSKNSKAKLQNYCNGINHTIRRRHKISSIPFEVKRDILSEEWTIKDVLKLYSLFSILSSIDFERDIFITKLKELLPREQFIYISKNLSILNIDPNLKKRAKSRIENKFYNSIYSIPNIEKSFLLKDFADLFLNSFYKNRFVFPFLSGDELYFPYYSSNTFYPSMYYPLNFYNKGQNISINAITIPGLPFPIGGILNHVKESKMVSLFLSPTSSSNYSFKAIKVNSVEDFEGKLREIEVKVKNSSSIKFKSVLLDEGFLLSPIQEIGNDSDSLKSKEVEELRYISFDKRKLYESVNDFLNLYFYEDDDGSNLDDSLKRKIGSIKIPLLNYYLYNNESDTAVVISARKKINAQLKNEILNDSLIDSKLFLSYESSKRYNYLALGNRFINEFLKKNESVFHDSNRISSFSDKSKYILKSIISWNKITLKEARASILYSKFVDKLFHNIFSDELLLEGKNNFCYNYLSENMNSTFNIIFPFTTTTNNNKNFNISKYFWDDNRTRERIENPLEIISRSLSETDSSFNYVLGYKTGYSFINNLFSLKFNEVLTPLKGKILNVDGNKFSFKMISEKRIPSFVFKVPTGSNKNYPGKVKSRQFIFAGGISENPLSSFFDDQLSFWKDDIYNDFTDMSTPTNILEKSINKGDYLLIIPRE